MRYFLWICVLVLAVVGSRPGEASTNPKMVALVVGNGAYSNVTELINPPADATAMAEALTTLGFDVIEVVDGDYNAMQRGFRQFGSTARGADVALFFYAGHGLQVNGENFLLPVTAQIEETRDLRYEAFPLSLLIGEIQDADPRISLIMLDACRDNPLTRSLRRQSQSLGRSVNIGRGLAPAMGASGMLIAYATAPGDVAYDGEGENSPFTTAFLDHIEEPGLEVGLLFRRVRQSVIDATDGAQVPWVEEALLGEFYLRPEMQAETGEAELAFEEAVGLASPNAQRAALEQFVSDHPDHALVAVARTRIDDLGAASRIAAERELAVWRSTQRIEAPEQAVAALEYYLTNYPDGQFTELAELQIAAFSVQAETQSASAAVDRASQEELSFWNGIRDSGNAADYRAYLDRYPDGQFTVLAESQVAVLSTEGVEPIGDGPLGESGQDGTEPSGSGAEPAGAEQPFQVVSLGHGGDDAEVEAGPVSNGTGVRSESSAHSGSDLTGEPLPGENPSGEDLSGEDLQIASLPDSLAGAGLDRGSTVDAVIGIGAIEFEVPADSPLRVQQLPDNGILVAGGQPLSAGDVVTPEQLRTLSFAPNPEAVGSEATFVGVPADDDDAQPTTVRMAVRVHECDRLAGTRFDVDGVVPGILINEVEPAVAIPACQSAVTVHPDVSRFIYQLGRSYDAAKDYTDAADWYGQAAESGYALAMNNLGYLYQWGRGVDQDFAKAMELYEQAAALGDPYAFNNLGKMYQHGQGIRRNYTEAVQWFQRAAEAGHTFGFNNLGWMYVNGYGVAQDYVQALAFFQQSADQGDIYGFNNVGWMYENGHGVQQDYEEAASWYRRAAEAGQDLAQNNLGRLYQSGTGVAKDLAEAARWYLAAAEQDHPWAQNNLGWLYHNGDGVPRDHVQAVRWYARAIATGDRGASRSARANLESLPRSAMIRAAQAMLVEAGYDPGPVDGMMGGQTRTAITDFERDYDLSSAGGQVTVDLVVALASL